MQNAADLADTDAPGLFAFINASLGDGSAAAAVHRRVHADERRGDGLGLGLRASQGEAGGRYFGNGAAAKAKSAPAPPGRQALAAQQVPLHGSHEAPCKELGAIRTRGTFQLHSTGIFPNMPVECERAFRQ